MARVNQPAESLMLLASALLVGDDCVRITALILEV